MITGDEQIVFFNDRRYTAEQFAALARRFKDCAIEFDREHGIVGPATYTVPEAVAALGLPSTAAIHRALANGLPCRRRSRGGLVITRTDLLEWFPALAPSHAGWSTTTSPLDKPADCCQQRGDSG